MEDQQSSFSSQPNSSYPSVQPASQPVMSSTPQPKSRKKLWIILGIAFVAIWIVGGLFVAFCSQKGSAPAVVSTEAIEKVAKDKALTPNTLATLDKDNTFWAYFKQAAQQTQLTMTKEYYFANSPSEKPTSISYMRSGFDYSSKKIVQAQEEDTRGLPARDHRRCYDGKEFYMSFSGTQGWRDTTSSKTLCDVSKADAAINDGINTGGLTAAQADTFIADIRKQSGLFTVKNLQLTEKNDKKYLHFTIALRPVASGKYDYMGNQWLMWAFKTTGLDPAAYPYGYVGAGGEGMDIEYYVDPTSKLPVYTEISTTPGKNSDGSEAPQASYSHYRVQYDFGKLPNVSTTNMQDISISW
jgi:hypothetical protein